LELPDQRLELRQRIIRRVVRMLRLVALPDLQLQRAMLARRVVAADPDIGEFADRSPGVDLVKASLAQDRRLQRKLRRQSQRHLLAGRRRAGLVVEDRVAAVATALDAVGARRKLECPVVVENDFMLAACFGRYRGDASGPRSLPLG